MIVENDRSSLRSPGRDRRTDLSSAAALDS